MKILITEKVKKAAFVMPDGTKVYINKFGRWYYIDKSGFGFEVEEELTALLSSEMAREIDSDIIRSLMNMGI